MRCVSYTRYVSCLKEKDTPPDIISRQNERIEAYCRKRKWTISKKYSDREVNRKAEKAFNNLREDGMIRKFDMVVIDSYYRLGPNIANAKNILSELFYPAGIHFAVVEDDFCSLDKTPEEVDRYFVEKNIYFRTKTRWMAHNSARENGFFNVHDEKYGYLLSEDRRSLVIDEEVAPVIREIFELMAGGNETMRSIAEIMQGKGYECPAVHLERVSMKHARANALEWNVNTIKSILFCRQYAGVARRKINGEYVELRIPPIISQELFDKAEAVRKVHRVSYHGSIRPKENLFRLIIKSAETGQNMVCKEVGKSRERRYCRVRKTKEDSIPYDYVVAKVTDLLKEEKALACKVETLLSTEEADKEMTKRRTAVIDDMTAIVGEISRIGNERRLLYEKAEGNIRSSELEELDMELDELEEEFKKKQEDLLIIAKTFLKNPWVELYRNIDLLTKQTNAQMKKMIEMVWVHDLKEVTIDVKHSEWKQLLPKEWFKEDGYGEEK